MIKFGAGIAASHVVASRSRSHVVFKIGSDDQITDETPQMNVARLSHRQDIFASSL